MAENTLVAFDVAARAGVKLVEFDVQLLQDKVRLLSLRCNGSLTPRHKDASPVPRPVGASRHTRRVLQCDAVVESAVEISASGSAQEPLATGLE